MNTVVTKPETVVFAELDRQFTFLRALCLSPVALIVTGLLIWGMERLIHTESLDPPVVRDWKVPSPVYVEPPPAEPIPPAPEKIIEPTVEPEIPKIEVEYEGDGGDFGVESFAPMPTRAGTTFSSDVPIATMLAQPDYPVRAANHSIEGYVDVRFDVAASGMTENVTVVSSMPERIFNKAAMNAVKRWKFQPAEKNGKPIPFLGMVQRITFQMGHNTQ